MSKLHNRTEYSMVIKNGATATYILRWKDSYGMLSEKGRWKSNIAILIMDVTISWMC